MSDKTLPLSPLNFAFRRTTLTLPTHWLSACKHDSLGVCYFTTLSQNKLARHQSSWPDLWAQWSLSLASWRLFSTTCSQGKCIDAPPPNDLVVGWKCAGSKSHFPVCLRRMKMKHVCHTPSPEPFFRPLFQQHEGNLKVNYWPPKVLLKTTHACVSVTVHEQLSCLIIHHVQLPMSLWKTDKQLYLDRHRGQVMWSSFPFPCSSRVVTRKK